MMQEGSVWQLFRGDQHIADLVVTEADFPWLYAKLHSRDGFEAVRPLFETELRLLDVADAEVKEWEAAHAAVVQAVSLRYPDGIPVPEFLLHVDGDDAWWRWDDEPFPA